jgi:hypothetical protein
MYGVACLGTDCDAHDGAFPLLMAFDAAGSSLLWGRAIEPESGSLMPSRMAVAPDGVWVGAELRGSAFGQESKLFDDGATLAGSTWFLKFPL